MSNTNENPHSSETPIIYNRKNGILSIEDSFSNTGSYCCFHSANDYNDCDEFIGTLSVCIENHSVCSIILTPQRPPVWMKKPSVYKAPSELSATDYIKAPAP